MIVMKLKLDNIYAFRDFEIDMSYPKKILNSTIEDEHLSGYPNFRYKKVNIIMGANASGKTTLGRAMMNIFSFISYKDIEAIEKMVFDSSAKASFLIDFIVKEKKLNRIMLDICPDEDGRRIYTFSYDSEKITSRDSYQSCAMRLDARPRTISDYNNGLEAVEKLGWLFSYPDISPRISPGQDTGILRKALEAILRTLDPSISSVSPLAGVNEPGFVIRKNGRDIVLQNGVVTDPDIFSSGTLEGIGIAYFLAGVMEGRYGFYFCDEKFSYIHSTIEQRIFSIMAAHLKEDGQLFFTTHNEMMMELNLPKHAYTFLAIRKSEESGKIVALYANDYIRKTSDNLRIAAENDVIRALPDDRFLDVLED